jgi:YVTN family beta-propeller protein
MKRTKKNPRLLPCRILNRHLLSYLAAAAIAAGPALQARAQEHDLELNAAAVPTNKVAATVPLSGYTEYMVVNRDDTFVYVVTYISSSSSYVISQIDTTTYNVITFPITAAAIGLAITPNGKQLYVSSNPGGNNGAVTILDASTGAVINKIDVYGLVSYPQISPDGRYAYVPQPGEGDVVVIETANQKVYKTIPISSEPWSVVFNQSGSLAYVTGSAAPDSVAEIDTATLKVTHTVSLGSEAAFSIVNRTTDDVWTPTGSSTNGSSAIAVIKGHRVIKSIATPTGAYIGYPAFTPNGKYAYVPESYLNGGVYNYVYMIDAATYKTVGTPIQVGNNPLLAIIAHNGKFVYVNNANDNTISVIQISPAQ